MQLLVMLFLCAVASGATTAFALRLAIYFSILPMLAFPTGWMIAQGDLIGCCRSSSSDGSRPSPIRRGATARSSRNRCGCALKTKN